MSRFHYAQTRFLSILLKVWLAIFVLTRGVLLLGHLAEADVSIGSLFRIFGAGFIYDLTFLAYAGLPLVLYLVLCPGRLWRWRWHRRAMLGVAALSMFVMLFVATAEWIFWDEFGVRFNFIAVDYLVYSKEVVNNIVESYPIYSLLSLLAAIALGLTYALRRSLVEALAAPRLSWQGSVAVLVVLSSLAALGYGIVDQDSPRGRDGNVYQRELASNGPYQFFAAFRNNELDYAQLYATLPDAEAAELLRREVAEPNARFLGKDPFDIRRAIDNPGETKRLNVVLVTIESLSAKYLGSFGDSRGLTPNLDALRQQSLTFTNFYATGTRTDRGLEAITLSMPPTPGRSIVKRIGRESGYASLGQQLKAQGYDSVFLYGGRGYFDNMNAFFGGNGYRIVDQSSVPEKDISFKNAWGMADEDLYTLAMKEADADYAANRPFLLQLMTTSNHRPYTYPEGRIDIVSGEGREGAVKYTDYAIGRFLAQAREKPWFDDTLFVFVADHTAGSAGREDLPVDGYHIPLFIYAPRHIAPGEFVNVASQIDLAPTLLGLLGMDYVSTFFGRNVLREDRPPGRALVGNYQYLGLFDGQDLAILGPRRSMRLHGDAAGRERETKATFADVLIRRDIAYYQGASYAFRNRLIAWPPEESVGGEPTP